LSIGSHTPDGVKQSKEELCRNLEAKRASEREYFKAVAAALGFDSRVDSHWYKNFPFVCNVVLGDEVNNINISLTGLKGAYYVPNMFLVYCMIQFQPNL
jgi:hypothetical protein